MMKVSAERTHSHMKKFSLVPAFLLLIRSLVLYVFLLKRFWLLIDRPLLG